MSVTDIGPLALELPNALIETLAQRVAAIVLERLEDTSSRRWLTVDQAADYLGRSQEAVRGLVKRRELTGYKPDGRLQLDREELDRWMRGVPDA
ncbi:MAG: helix-turn-helix domain-containing protein [Actinomycetota bacterium]|nr:helix-turn-helix domain-containing protein [Actinomycetota bacterium]